jgi:serralysin
VLANGAISNFTLPTNVENFSWTGSNSGANVTGNAQDNIIVGGNGTNGGRTISGLDGNDTLSGGSGGSIFIGGNGNDLIHGSSGADQFRYLGGETGVDAITVFQSGADKFALSRSYFTPSATVDSSRASAYSRQRPTPPSSTTTPPATSSTTMTGRAPSKRF